MKKTRVRKSTDGGYSYTIGDQTVRAGQSPKRVAMTEAYAPGTRVIVQPTHWNPRRHGAIGTVFSTATSAQGAPTHYVTFDRDGDFVLVADLRAIK